MKRPALAGTTNRTPAPDRANNPMEGYHPDVIEAARVLGITRPRGLEHLRGLHDRIVRRADRAADNLDMAAVLVMSMGRRGSVAVDRSVGELVARTA